MKNKQKIGLALLIALVFIVPPASIMANVTDGVEAVVEQEHPTRHINEKFAQGSEQAAGDILPMGVKMENPAHEQYDIPATLPVEEYYEFLAGLFVEPLEQEEYTSVQSGLSLYSIDEGVEVIMYATSFEDNFDIYNNWMQIDQDCGLSPNGEVGFYDTWTWSDARASDGDHSMKNTMYPIYKGNQDDILLCTKVFDVCDQYYYNVSFDIWVEGQWYDTYNVPPPEFYADYVLFEMSVDGGITWSYFGVPYADTTMPLNYRTWNITSFVTEIGGGWWHVNHQFVVEQGECEEVMFRFRWISDPEYQYEGAYIDNFQVLSIEGVEEKIWQTFTQECTEVPTGEAYYIKYPLKWENVIPGDYYVKYWVEVEDCDPDYHSTFPKPGLVIPFTIENVNDCEVKDLIVENSFTHAIVPDEGSMEEGSDAHIMFTFCNNGNVAREDIPIGLEISKKIYEEEFTWDCENDMPITSSYGEVGTDDFIAKDGSKSLYFGNPVTKTYEPYTFIYADFGPRIDFSTALEVYLEFDYRALTDEIDDGDPVGLSSGSAGGDFPYGDFVYPYILDEDNNGVYGYGYYSIAGAGNWEYVLGGFHPEWVHVKLPMKPVYNYLKAGGAFDDAYGVLNPEHRLGFLMLCDYDSIHWSETGEGLGYDESGVWIDNIKITTQKIGDPVYEDTLIIPGPVEPTECIDAQFEWEEVPFSNYHISVFDECNDPYPFDDNDEVHQQVLVITDLERADDKNTEGIDYTGGDCNEWGISSSDYDNYLATNADSEVYEAFDSNYVLFSQDHETCDPTDPDFGDTIVFDVNGLVGPILLEFNAWWNLETSADFVYLEISDVIPDDDNFVDWLTDVGPVWLWNPIITFTGNSYSDLLSADSDGFLFFDGTDYPPIDLAPFVPTDGTFALRFRFDADMGVNRRGLKIDDIAITNAGNYLFGIDTDDDDILDAPDPCDDMDNWCTGCIHWGQYWTDTAPWCIDPIPYLPIENALVWETEIKDAYEAYLTIDFDYCMDNFWVNFGIFEFWIRWIAKLEISIDGGNTWDTLDVFEGCDAGINTYDISAYAGNDILVRINVYFDGHISPYWVNDQIYGYTPETLLMWVWNAGYISKDGNFCVNDMYITGKEDNTPPVSTIQMSGTMADAGWYSTPVNVKITAVDDNCVKEIHYILDGKETVVSGDTATFTISSNGQHTLSFWAVDCVGNVETMKSVPTFRIDAGSPPTVSITAPEPGLYLFGNKLLSSSKVFIIGAFTIEAAANDAESGVYRVQFYLDNDLISEDTEAPFSAYCAQKHMGKGTIKAVAEDFSGNSAQDTLDITYYKFL